jgi:tetratricopeptide (TPR) repeat protein
MKCHSCVLYWLAIVALNPIALQASDHFSPEVDSLVQHCIDYTFNGDYKEAYQVCDRIEELKDGAMAPFYRLAVMGAEIIDYEDTLGLSSFFAESEKCIGLAQARIDSGIQTADDYFYIGSTLAYEALFYGHQGNIWQAYQSAVKSRKVLETCLDMDSSYMDARLGIGTYQYWMSKKLGVLTWLPVIHDERKQGIAQLERVIDENALSKYLAISSLANIRIDQKEYGKALELALRGLERYPNSRGFLWQEGAAATGLKNYRLANSIYENLLKQVMSLKRNNHFNELSCYQSLSEGYYYLGDYITCIELARKALALPLTDALRQHKKNTLKQIVHYLGLAEEKIARGQ